MSSEIAAPGSLVEQNVTSRGVRCVPVFGQPSFESTNPLWYVQEVLVSSVIEADLSIVLVAAEH